MAEGVASMDETAESPGLEIMILVSLQTGGL